MLFCLTISIFELICKSSITRPIIKNDRILFLGYQFIYFLNKEMEHYVKIFTGNMSTAFSVCLYGCVNAALFVHIYFHFPVHMQLCLAC